MRYYEFVLSASKEDIKQKSKIQLRNYDYESVVGGINRYLFHNMISTVRFIIHCEENNVIQAVFSYDETAHTFDFAYNYILNTLSETFGITKVKEEPYEITSCHFYECYIEAKRRQIISGYSMIDMARLRLFEELDKEGRSRNCFNYKEKIIRSGNIPKTSLYDKSLANEISNIEAHANTSQLGGNIVHYIISARSTEAATDITEALINSLYKANRISTGRMICLSNLAPSFHRSASYIEEMIANNSGGVVVIDLSVRFGDNQLEYDLACKYIENLVKKYRNKCLFAFTYNMDAPGFAFKILRELNKYIIPVTIREGSGNRRAATAYLKRLIKASEYSVYHNQAGEFLKNFPGDTFTQTDVLMAFEKFGAWCINKNVLNAYNNVTTDEYLLDRDENAESAEKKLDSMIGLKCVKEQIRSILATNNLEKERRKYSKKASASSTMHMIFSGNPGSAKTTVARLFAGIAKEKGLLKSGAFVEASGVSINSSPFAAIFIKNYFEAAVGGVLFIDEAYAICNDNVVTALIQEMENRRDEVIVVLAGYESRMKVFMQCNEGLKSRIPYWIDFPDYDAEELTEIFKLMLENRGFTATEDAIKEANYIFDKVRLVDDFGNGRYVRNLIERAIQNQSVRLSDSNEDISKISKKNLFMLTRADISSAYKRSDVEEEYEMTDDEESLESAWEKKSVDAKKELEDMIGLSSVKSVIKKVIAGAKVNKYCKERGIKKDRASLHMLFTGNPGTAKTTIARLFGEIMAEEKLLPTGVFVEAGRADLIGQFVGHTALKIVEKFKEARGGILFIDEAYSLCDNDRGSFGDEAITTIVREMENHREDTVVIFAGYPDEMQRFLDKNSGLSSRIAFHINFDDYSTEELCDITKLMLAKKHLTITDEAMAKLKESYDIARESSDYGNGRYVRKMLEEAEMNLAQRICEMEESQITNTILTTIEECDIPTVAKPKSEVVIVRHPIGFQLS